MESAVAEMLVEILIEAGEVVEMSTVVCRIAP